jgi:hypothetical protein
MPRVGSLSSQSFLIVLELELELVLGSLKADEVLILRSRKDSLDASSFRKVKTASRPLRHLISGLSSWLIVSTNRLLIS